METGNPPKEKTMKSSLSLCCTTLLMAALALPANAQPGSGTGGGVAMGPGQGAGMSTGKSTVGKRAPRDCSRAANPGQCQARQAARQQAAEACKDKSGRQRRQCMHDHMPPVDCAKSPHPQRCEAKQKANESCQDKAGPQRRQCMRAAMKAK